MKERQRSLRAISFMLILCICVGLLGPVAFADEVEQPGADTPAEETPIYLDQSYSFEERAADLVARMTLNQKASQMISGYSPAIPELGMNWYGWWNESLHGVSRLQNQRNANAPQISNTTSYPISLAMGSTWNPELMYRVAVEIGDEAREVTRGNAYELTFYSPTVNLLRDPRWGRADESFSEDALLTAVMASQFVNGMEGKDQQGNRLDENGYLKTITTIKHYLGNNSEGNRLKGSTNLTEKEMREYYSYVYRLVVEQSDVSSVMAAYNRVNEVPANLDHYILDELLRQTFGFTGYVTADCNSVAVAYRGNGYDQNPLNPTSSGHGWRHPDDGHKMPATEIVAWAVAAGGDLQCNNGHADSAANYNTAVPTAVEQGYTTPSGLFDENAVDVSLHRLLKARMELGEFDLDTGDVSWYNEARERIERDYGADWVYNLSSLNSNPGDTITEERLDLALEAAHEALVLLKNEPVGDTPLLPIQVPADGEFKVAVVGVTAYANATNQFLGGYSARMTEDGQAKMVTPYNGIREAILEINPDADVSFVGISNKGTAISDDQLAELAGADLVIFYAGSDDSDGNEDRDRTSLDLPGLQADNIIKAAEANANTVVVMETISTNYIGSFMNKVPAIVWSGYNGMLKGTALGDALVGNVNFSGRTSTVWFASNDQMLSTYSYRLNPGEDTWPYAPHTQYNTGGAETYTFGNSPGRTYMYYDESLGGALLYPFGYGLSYTDFEYSNLVVNGLSDNSVDANGTLSVSVDVTNTGTVDGAEVVQIYMATPGAPAELLHPNNRLVGFQKVNVPAGQTVTANVDVAIKDLAFFIEETARFEVYNGAYQLQVAKNHKDIELTRDFTVAGSLTPVVSVVSAKPVQSGDREADIAHRVLFDLGKTVDPQLTVAMSDDTLYGYIIKGKGSELPSRFEVEYESNRPAVVEVEDGVIRTRTSGVATITATVTDSVTGSVGSVDFVVYVVPGDGPMLETLAVNGVLIENFEPGLRSYTYVAPVGSEASAYTITATAMDGHEVVEITQLTEIPGEAKVTVTNGDTTMDYVIRFIFDEPQILELVAENGTVTAYMNMWPDDEISLEDFEAQIALDAMTGLSLELSNMVTDREALTVTFSYPEVAKIERPQVVHITLQYKHTPAVSTFFDLEEDHDLLYSILVNGTLLRDFSYPVRSYTYTAYNGEIPEVMATAANSNVTVTVTQAEALFESAKVTFAGDSGTDSYLITFVPESTTRFDSLPGDWEILNGTGAETYASYGMTVPASRLGSGNDFPSVSMQNMLQYTGSLDGDWEVTLKVTGDRSLGGVGNYANYGIGLNNTGDGSGNNHLKLVQLNSGSNSAYQYTAGFSSNNTHSTFNYTTAWLRLVKEGNSYTGLISSDGVSFTTIRTINDTAGALDGAKLQLFVTGNQSASVDLNATFEYINMEMEGDIPDPDLATITFRVSPEDAEVEVYDSENELVEPTSNPLVYELEPGSYHYTVSAEGYLSESAGFEVSGDATITVELEFEEEIIEPESIEITGSLSVKRGRTTQLTLVVEPEGAVARGVTWELLTPDVAEIDDNGLLTAGSQPGIVVVMATTENGLSAQFVLQITA